MQSIELEYSHFEGDIFFIKKKDKREKVKYGVARLNFKNLMGLLLGLKCSEGGRPLPVDLTYRLNNNIIPRLEEIKKFIENNNLSKNIFGIEVSEQERTDIIYKINLPRIKQKLKDNGYYPLEILDSFIFIQFIEYGTL